MVEEIKEGKANKATRSSTKGERYNPEKRRVCEPIATIGRVDLGTQNLKQNLKTKSGDKTQKLKPLQ